MLFHQPLVSLVAAISLASSITAATVQAPPSCPSSGSLTCCVNTVPYYSLSYDEKDALGQLDSNLDTNLPVGIDCVQARQWGSWQTCNSVNQQGRLPFCCDGIQTQAPVSGVAGNCNDSS
ncbi:hypothetical protein EI94DRAFT_1762233 [Lactarius quietus]|nr:hypothetical protein EI94DRAFT_1762233 [Lactarius quietus]